jgi:hypothetical protein
MKTPIALTLLLVSCGAAVASPAQSPTESISPSLATTSPSTAPPLTTENLPAVTEVAPVITDAEAAFPARLVLTTKDGQAVTFSPHADPVATTGVSDPTGRVSVTATTVDGQTMVEWHDLRTDVVTATQRIAGDLHPTAVSQDGEVVALIDSLAASTTVVLATAERGEARRWNIDAVVVPEAFSSVADLGAERLPYSVYVIEYLAAHTYRVRVIPTETGQLGLPISLRNKTLTVDEVMTAVSRTAVFDRSNQLLFTLYQNATEDGADVGSFVHTLGVDRGVWCLDVPAELGLADHPGALAVSPDGQRLFAASSTGGVAGYVIADITDYGPAMPAARAVASLDSSSSRVAVGASNNEVVVALGGSLFRLDPVTLAVRDSFSWDMGVEALTVLNDGSVVIVGTGRMTLVSATDQILAERALPAGTADVTRIAALA